LTKALSIASSHEGELEVVVLIKAAPEIGQRHGETVCVAGVDAYGKWHRLYPVPYRDLTPSQKFVRWDRIRVRWRAPTDDDRVESKRIDPSGLQIVSKVTGTERAEVAARAVVSSLDTEMQAGRSLALIRPQNVEFLVRRLSQQELAKSARRRAELIGQVDMFAPSLIAKEPPPYAFYYRFDHAGQRRTHICIDWETEQTFLSWRSRYGETETLNLMKDRWGSELPAKGLVLAMGTHRVRMFNSWLLSGVIQAPELAQMSLVL
jgi:hypothetical protein